VKARLRGELAPFALLVAAALVVRLIDLGDRPFHHDESQDAYFSWILAERGDYQYQPILHGPLRFYLTAAVYKLVGDSDFTARLAPVLMGTVAVGLPYLLRRELGRVAAIAAAVMLAFGPTYLYFSRFAREDIYMACLNLALLVAVFRFVEAPRRWHPAVIGALLAAAMATKEATFITGFVFFTFLVAWFAVRRHDLLGRLRAVDLEAYGYGFAAFAAVFTILFTVFLTRPDGLWDGLYDGLAYWLEQHGPGRGEKEWFFYSVVLVAHEWPVLLLAAVGAVVAVRSPTPLRLFLIWAFVLQQAIYSWANERFTWLVMHPLLPLILLAGIGVQAIWSARGRWPGRAGLALIAVGAAYMVFASWNANALHRADPREFLVTTQSSEEVLGVRDDVLETAADLERRGLPVSITVDAAEGATFPWAWYFRDLPAGYIDLSAASATLPDSSILLLTEGSRSKFLEQLDGSYDGRRFRFRVWWVRDYSKLRGGFVEWLLRREPWNETGGMWEWLYVRREEGAGG
jgi:uncharacterized protein (TIGR03663 family)